jgi:hypothetical protein
MTEQWELCSVGSAVKIDTARGHEQYGLDEYVKRFINPGIKLNTNQTYQDFIYPRLISEGWEPFGAVHTVSLSQPMVYFRRKIKAR